MRPALHEVAHSHGAGLEVLLLQVVHASGGPLVFDLEALFAVDGLNASGRRLGGDVDERLVVAQRLMVLEDGRQPELPVGACERLLRVEGREGLHLVRREDRGGNVDLRNALRAARGC